MRGERLTVPEALAATVVCFLAAIIALSYVWARVGPLTPLVVLALAIATAGVAGMTLVRRANRDTPALLAFCAVVGVLLGWLLWLAHPAFLPPGAGPDLTHHLMLVDYIERHWQLPEPGLVAAMGEMVHYTPGLHLLAALAGVWSGTGGLQAIYPLVAFTVALKAAFVFLIALRITGNHAARVPLGLTAVILLLLPRAYFLGPWVNDSFLAQVAAELFAVAMWWALVVFDEKPSRVALVLFAAAGVGAFLTWPIWIGPPLVVLAAVVLTHDQLRMRDRVEAIAVAACPIVLVAFIHAAGRAGWIGIAATTGAVLRPSLVSFGWPFVILATAGLLIALARTRARATLILTLSIIVQAATLYLLAEARGASTPYMAWKMFYLLIYPLAVLGAFAIAIALSRGHNRLRQGYGGPPKLYAKAEGPRYMRESAAWALLVVAMVAYWKPLRSVKIPAPVVSEDLYHAGRWARAHVEAACVDYLVPSADTMYWLHLAVLGNPRSSLRTADPDTFVPARAIARWIEPGGLPYAIADVSTLPKEVLNDVDILEQFGQAAVVKRRGPSSCSDAQRYASENDDRLSA